MINPEASVPPFSPVLLAGFLSRPFPLRPLQMILSHAMKITVQQHPGLFERLDILENPLFRIDPVDLPLAFELQANQKAPGLRAIRRESEAQFGSPSATIRGPFLSLIELLQGQTDGDALFFSRALTVEGDTEAVLALRNAVDAAEIDLWQDVLKQLGPMSRVLETGSGRFFSVFERMNHDISVLQASLLSPVARRQDQLAAKLKRTEETVFGLKKDLKRKKPQPLNSGAVA